MLGGFSLNSHTTALRLGGYSCAHLPNGRPEAPRSQCPLSQGYQGAEARPNSGLIYCLFPCSLLRIAAFSGISVFHFLIRDPETFWAVYFDQRPHPIHIFIMPPNKQILPYLLFYQILMRKPHEVEWGCFGLRTLSSCLALKKAVRNHEFTEEIKVLKIDSFPPRSCILPGLSSSFIISCQYLRWFYFK